MGNDLFQPQIKLLDSIQLRLTILQAGGLFGEFQGADRSEERRVGKECRSRWSPYH